MSNLYKEALVEAKKLKKLAEEDAGKKILEEISPLIKKAITDQINESADNFFVEDNTDAEMDQTTDPLTAPSVDSMSPAIDPTGLDNKQTGGLPDADLSAPLSPKGAESGILSATMPGQDGKMTVDFEDLFVDNDSLKSDVGTPTEEPPVAAPEAGPVEPAVAANQPSVSPEAEQQNIVDQNNPEEIVSMEGFSRALSETSKKINEAFYLNNLTVVGKEKIKEELFGLLEKLDFLTKNNIINKKESSKNENKLDFLLLKLKEAKLSNSYIKNDRRDSNNMKSLKEYAAKLFEEDNSFSKPADKKLNHGSTASDEQPKKQSGVSPEVGGPKDLKAATEKVNAKSPVVKQWAEGEPELKEEVDVDEKELKEAIECLTTKVEKKEGWEKAEPEEVDPSHKNLKEDIGDELALGDSEGEDLGAPMGDEGMEMAAVDSDGVDPDIVLNIELPDEIEDALASIDVSALDGVKVDVADINLGAGQADGDSDEDDMELDFGGDSVDVPDVAAEPAQDDSEEEDEKEIGEAYPKMKEAFIKLLKNHKLLEAKLAQVEAENKALKESVTKDRSALKEANLFLAKNVYFTKFLQRNDISKKNLTKIVEYLDRAESVNDAKGIYNKIKAKLAESAKTSNKLVGSPSKVTSPGSANKTLTESVSHVNEDGFDVGRWAVIAGINKSSK
jgi:hypothetical protein